MVSCCVSNYAQWNDDWWYRRMFFLPIYQRRRRQEGETCSLRVLFFDPLNPITICAISRQNPHRHRISFNGDMVNLLPMLLVAYTSGLESHRNLNFTCTPQRSLSQWPSPRQVRLLKLILELVNLEIKIKRPELQVHDDNHLIAWVDSHGSDARARDPYPESRRL